VRHTSSQFGIRSNFLLRHFERRERAWRRRHELITARDDKHRELNRHYGFREPDGSIPIGCKSHVDLEYKAQYDRIECDFRPLYEAVSRNEDQTDRDDGITIFEFLVLDNLGTHERDRFVSVAKSGQYADYIALRARCEVQGQASDLTVRNVPQVVAMIIHNASFAGRRCRKFFNLQPWNVEDWYAIYSYRRRYRRALREAANNPRAISG
jgi:hypothetical protein